MHMDVLIDAMSEIIAPNCGTNFMPLQLANNRYLLGYWYTSTVLIYDPNKNNDGAHIYTILRTHDITVKLY